MSAPLCEKCAAPGKTYWVGDREWLCTKCFKATRAAMSPAKLEKERDLWGK